MPLLWWGISALTILLGIAFLINILLYRRLNSRMKHFESSSLTLQTFMSGHRLDTFLEECIQKLAHQEQGFN
jgi:hypothetical protein